MSRVLVIGATGYIGGRLVPRLVQAGHVVRCLARNPRKLAGRSWQNVEVVQGDVFDPDSIANAAMGCEVLYYLVHSMATGEGEFEERDRHAARNTVTAAEHAGVQRIIYVGGLGKRASNLSAHLRSRNEVGEILRSGKCPVTEFRAAMVIGSGSLSFELMHALVNRLPIMTAPKWVSTRSQPIAVRDVLRYLVDCLSVPASIGRVIDIGGPDILTYRDMMLRFAKLLGFRRWIIVVPVLTPRLSSLWVNFVTPVSATIARPLIEGLKSEMVCESDLALKLFPFNPLSFENAAKLALERIRSKTVETRWSNAAIAGSEEEGGLEGQLQLLSDVQTSEINASPEKVFQVFSSIGGTNGWYYADFLWGIRGFIDKMIGGVGLRRGRRHPVELLPGEALDFWRVEEAVPAKFLLLRAEMKVPGRAWLEFKVEPGVAGGSHFTQTARFYPRGIFGLFYWYSVYPIHVMVFRGMARGVKKRAEC